MFRTISTKRWGSHNTWGITYLYGCTALLISDPDFVIVAHLLQSAGKNIICINDDITLDNYLSDTLQPALERMAPSENTQVEVIYNTRDCPSSKADGIQTIKNWLTDGSKWGVSPANIRYRPYSGGSGTGEPNPGQPDGLAAIRVKLLASLVCQTLLTSNTTVAETTARGPNTRYTPDTLQHRHSEERSGIRETDVRRWWHVGVSNSQSLRGCRWDSGLATVCGSKAGISGHKQVVYQGLAIINSIDN
ncbi:hypothetical protein BDZ45DRAFT_697947 [Acephala macrosclerotiorum]|nr:hypothetical protein BDZ45DRAFT_697947 [Acephala macrosclerotiorum]